MARPTKPKDLKPKADGDAGPAPVPAGGGSSGGAAFDIKYIVLLVVVVMASILGSAGSSYLMATMVISPDIKSQLAHIQPAGGEDDGGDTAGGEEGDGHGKNGEVGMNLELDEFTVNLKQDAAVGGNQYLRAKMALSIKVPEEENCYLKKEHALVPGVSEIAGAIPGGKIAGAAAPVGHQADRTTIANGGEAGPSCEQIFKDSMGKFVPTVRDVVNGALMKRTATQLASLEGQEALKDEVKEQLNPIMAPNYEVLRVNFQDFIIQR